MEKIIFNLQNRYIMQTNSPSLARAHKRRPFPVMLLRILRSIESLKQFHFL